jgi:hypothetical protein
LEKLKAKFLLAFTKLLLNYKNHYQDEFCQEIAYIKPTGLLKNHTYSRVCKINFGALSLHPLKDVMDTGEHLPSTVYEILGGFSVSFFRTNIVFS